MKKKSTRKWVIPLVIISIFVFTGVAIWLQYAIGMELSPTLITCFYGFCGGELWLLSGITKEKIRNDAIDSYYREGEEYNDVDN